MSESQKLTTKVLIVDDHPVVVSGCKSLFASDPSVKIEGVGDAKAGHQAFLQEQPDVTVIDIKLPDVSGFELMRQIRKEDPDAKIIMFSMNDDPIFAARAIQTGAKGYVSKSGDPGDLLEAIRKVGEGGVFLPSAIAQSLAFARPGFADNRLAKLTPREVEILRLLGAGKSLSEIAYLINASYKTIANTSSIMRQKLGLRSSSELVRFAIENRLV